MSIDFQGLAQSGIKAIKKTDIDKKLLLMAPKFDMPNDCYDGTLLNKAGIERIMKKLELLIAQATQRLSEAEQKYSQEAITRIEGRGTRETQLEFLNAKKVLKDLKIKKANLEANPQAIQEYLIQERKSPNTSFLFDPLMEAAEKKALLAQHSEIVRREAIYEQIPELKTTIKSEKFFTPTYVNKSQIYLDMSNPTNAQNFTILKSKQPKTINNLAEELGLSPQDVRRYIANGFFDEISLINAQSQSLNGINAVDMASETTQKGLERVKQLSELTPKVPMQIKVLQGKKKSIMVPIDYLVRMGYGDNKTISDLLMNNKIATVTKEVTTKSGDKKLVTYVDTLDSKASSVLKYAKSQNKNLLSVEQMAKRAKVSKTEIEEALLSGELRPILEDLGERETITINLADRKNAEYLEKKLFEADLVRQDRNATNSLRNKLAWYFCPNTKKAASEAFSHNEENLNRIKKEIKALKELLENPDLKPEEVSNLEEALTTLKEKEEIELRKTFGFMWSTAGAEEYKSGMDKAKAIIKQFKTQGIDSIQDENIREIITAYQN